VHKLPKIETDGVNEKKVLIIKKVKVMGKVRKSFWKSESEKDTVRK